MFPMQLELQIIHMSGNSLRTFFVQIMFEHPVVVKRFMELFP